jgi:ankyrin repeat protein
MHIAAADGHEEFIQLLIRLKSDVNVKDRWGGGKPHTHTHSHALTHNDRYSLTPYSSLGNTITFLSDTITVAL